MFRDPGLYTMALWLIRSEQRTENFCFLLKTSLLLFSLVPIIASAIQLFTYGVSLINITLVGLVVLLYIFSLVDMNSAVDKANKQEIQLPMLLL